MSVTKTNVLFESNARAKLLSGMKLAAEAVCCTLGPKGKCVLIQDDNDNPIVTKDGVSVSKAINLKDPFERMGANLIREAASRTNETAGDGTTTATTLAYALISECDKLLTTGYDQVGISRGIRAAHASVAARLLTASRALTTREEIAQVATISANGDRNIGDVIASAFEAVGNDGIITVEDAKGTVTMLDVVEGMQLERGYLSPYFVNNNEKMHASYAEARVLVTDKKLSVLAELVPCLEQLARSGSPLLIIADDVDGDALQGLVLNKVKANLPVVAIKAPGYGDTRAAMLGDLCALTGATLVSATTGVGLRDIDVNKHLGRCKRVVVDAKTTTMVCAKSTRELADARVAELKTQLTDITLAPEEAALLRHRIAKLTGGVAVIRVGGMTEIEMTERKYRIEDALNATRAAIQEGIVKGGGTALLEASRTTSPDVEDVSYLAGWKALSRACCAPLRRIVENAGKSPDVVIDAVFRNEHKLDNVGYDGSKDEIGDLFERGIIDPCRVTRAALENAVSVAVTFVSLGAVVTSVEE